MDIESIRWDVRFAVISAFCEVAECEVCEHTDSAPVVLPEFEAITWK